MVFREADSNNLLGRIAKRREARTTMYGILSCFCLLLFFIASPALHAFQQSEATPAVLQNGTPVRLRLLRLGRTVSSSEARVGDSVDLRVIEEVKVVGIPVIPRGC